MSQDLRVLSACPTLSSPLLETVGQFWLDSTNQMLGHRGGLMNLSLANLGRNLQQFILTEIYLFSHLHSLCKGGGEGASYQSFNLLSGKLSKY